jgi:UDP-N-acetylmuramyl pentapeptide synthase
MGLAETIIVERVANLRRYQKTMLSYVVDDCLVIDDSYNINIDGVKAACRLLADSEEYTHKVLVVNEINEL